MRDLAFVRSLQRKAISGAEAPTLHIERPPDDGSSLYHQGADLAGPRGRAAAAGTHVTADQIKLCESLDALSSLIQVAAVGGLPMVPTTAALVRLAKLRGAGGGQQGKRKGSAGAAGASEPSEREALVSSLMAILLPRVMAVAWEMDTQGVASCLWALSKLPLQGKIETEAQVRAEHATSEAQPPPPFASTIPVFKELVTVAGRLAASMDAVNISNSLYAIAVVDQRYRQLHKRLPSSSTAAGGPRPTAELDSLAVQSLLDASGLKMYKMSPQALSNTAWALARLGARPTEAWTSALLSYSGRMLRVMQPMEMATLAWALFRLGSRPDSDWGGRLFKASQDSLDRSVM